MINFIITSENIEGPWSEPHIIEGAPGIDPDIIFDDDGTVWYVGTHSPSEPNFNGEGEIWLQQLDLKTWSLTGERYYLWRGNLGRRTSYLQKKWLLLPCHCRRRNRTQSRSDDLGK